MHVQVSPERLIACQHEIWEDSMVCRSWVPHWALRLSFVSGGSFSPVHLAE